MNFKRLAALTLAIILVSVSVSSCNKPDNSSDKNNSDAVSMPVPGGSSTSNKNNESPDASDSITESTENNTDTADQKTDLLSSPFKNKLTGLGTTEQLSNQRPIAIMFNNLKAATPQHGISQMDVVYEAIVEGSITRLLGVVTDWESLPTLGSIRSSRDYYIDFSDAHNAIYVHAGGSELAYSTMSQRKTDHIDGVNGPRVSSNAFYRNQDRIKKGIGIEHTLFSSGERLAKAIEGNKFTTTLKDGFVSPLKFSQETLNIEGDTANYVYVPFSTYAQSYFDYDNETGLYNKGQYLSSKSSLDKHNSPHIDGNTNEQINFKNVVILFTRYTTIDNVGRQAVQFTGTGTGYYITDGKCKEITWSRQTRTGGYTLYEADGKTELLMNPGKSYIGFVKPNTDIVYK